MTTNLTDRINGVLSSLAIKAPCLYATTGNITLSGLGTRSGGPWGSALTAGDRILVMSQTDTTENGIYDADSSEWSRSNDFDGNRDVTQGTRVAVVNSGNVYELATANPITIGTSNITFDNTSLVSYGRTADEEAAGVTPSNYYYNAGDIRRYGAVGDGVTMCTTAIANAVAVAAVGGTKVFAPVGVYLIDDVIIIDTGDFDIGIIFEGEGRNSIIQQTGAGKDAFWFSNTQILQNSGFRDLHIISNVTAGHCINIKYGCTTCFFENVELEVYSPNKAVIYGDYTSSGAGIYDTKFKGGSWYVSSSSVQSGFRVIANGTIFNENSFENLRCYNANTAQFFQITTTTTGTIWLINNSWRNINFEVCKGGGFYVDSFKNGRFENISFWDSQGDYTNNLIQFASGVGYESESNLLMNIGRNGDALDAGVCDILITSGQDTTIINCYTQAGDSPVYNFNNKRVTVIGPLVGTINNTGGTFKIGNPFGRLQFPGTVNGAFLDYYDEGTWTAQLTGSTTNPTTPVSVTGYWTRIGRLVTVTAEFLDVSTVGATGDVIVDGLPFNVASSRSYGQASIVNMGSDVVVASPFVGSDFVYFYLATNRAALLAHSAGTGRYLAFTASYTA